MDQTSTAVLVVPKQEKKRDSEEGKQYLIIVIKVKPAPLLLLLWDPSHRPMGNLKTTRMHPHQPAHTHGPIFGSLCFICEISPFSMTLSFHQACCCIF